MSIPDYFNRLRSTNSRKEKEVILTEAKNSQFNDDFKRVCFYALDPRHNFNIKEFPDTDTNFTGEITLNDAIQVITEELLNNELRGNKAIDLVSSLYNQLSQDDAEVFKTIIKRDLKCGVQAKTLNKVWDDLIYVHPYMRCSSFSEKNLKNIKLPAFSQVKEDGMYIDMVVNDNGVVYQSRSGQILNWNIKALDKTLLDYALGNVLMGEILVLNEDKTAIMDRSSGNGYLNSDSVDAERLLFRLWDCVPYNDWIKLKTSVKYEHRFNALKEIVFNIKNNISVVSNFDRVDVVETRIVETIDDIIQHFRDNVSNGLEGSVVKNKDSYWEDGTSKFQVKIKTEFVVELEIYDFENGEKGKQFEETLGSLLCRSLDDKLHVSVSSGLTHQLREEIHNNKERFRRMIVSVKANHVGLTENNEFYTLFHPRIVEIRYDKTEADDLERILEQRDAAVESLKIIE